MSVETEITWTHSICRPCWDKQRPGDEPHRVVNGPEDVCCFCGDKTTHGIYIRVSPKDKSLLCKGEHVL